MSTPPPSPDPPVATRRGSPDYRDDGRAVYWLKYYVLLVTRRRREFFADATVRARAEELLRGVAEAQGCVLTHCRLYPSSVVLHVEAPPTLSPHVLVTRLREDTAGPLKEEFEEVRRAGAVFVRRYMVTTVPVPETDGETFEGQISSR